MTRRERMACFRVLLGTSPLNHCLIPPRGTTLTFRDKTYTSIKLDFLNSKKTVLYLGPIAYEIKETNCFTYTSIGNKADLKIYTDIGVLHFKCPVKTGLGEFTSKDSVLPYRFGGSDRKSWKGCKVEVYNSTFDDTPTVLSYQPIDFDLKGNLKILNKGEPWLGFLTNDNSSIIPGAGEDLVSAVRELKINTILNDVIYLSEIITYTFKSGKSYIQTNYYTVYYPDKRGDRE